MTIHSLRRGGAERIALDLAHGLQARGHTILLAPLLTTNEYPRETQGLNVAPLLAADQYRWPTCLPSIARELRQVMKKMPVDVIQAHTPTAALVAAWAGVGAPVQHVIHGYGTIARPPSLKAALSRQADRWACRRTAARITVVAESMRPAAGRHFGQQDTAISCVPNGVDTDKFAWVERPRPRAPKILMVGTLAGVKRPDLAIAAMPALLRECPGAILTIAGDGPLREALRRQIGLRGLEGKVRLIGRHEDVPALMQDATLFWHLSASEGLPLAVAEAMATGLPVIGHDVRGVRDLIIDGKSGFLIPYEDIRALVRRSLDLLASPGRAAAIGGQARQRVVGSFSKPRMLAAHEAILAQLAAGQPGQQTSAAIMPS